MKSPSLTQLSDLPSPPRHYKTAPPSRQQQRSGGGGGGATLLRFDSHLQPIGQKTAPKAARKQEQTKQTAKRKDAGFYLSAVQRLVQFAEDPSINVDWQYKFNFGNFTIPRL